MIQNFLHTPIQRCDLESTSSIFLINIRHFISKSFEPSTILSTIFLLFCLHFLTSLLCITTQAHPPLVFSSEQPYPFSSCVQVMIYVSLQFAILTVFYFILQTAPASKVHPFCLFLVLVSQKSQLFLEDQNSKAGTQVGSSFCKCLLKT